MIAIGSPAPHGQLPDSAGVPVQLLDVGVPTLIVFLPAAFTPLCSDELGALVRIDPAVRSAGVQLRAIACDSMFALRTWIEGAGANDVRVLSDFWPHGEVSRHYGAFDERLGISTRTSYLVDGQGVVAWSAASAAGVARDFDEHLAAVNGLCS